jgi:ribonuclease P protein component
VRRRLRAAIAARLEAIPGGTDVVVMARPASASASWAELCCALDAALREALR